uniref:Uncharacterized protein n=1 Tax=Meloidogyne javanica TaxID=6303 RepID=A0A915MRC3_MELJA
MVNDNGLDAQSKEIKLKDLKEAFKVLSDETSRARYDYYLKNIPGKGKAIVKFNQETDRASVSGHPRELQKQGQSRNGRQKPPNCK